MAGMAMNIAKLLKEGFETSPIFPYDDGSRHKRNPKKPHARVIALEKNQIQQLSTESVYFEIGNEEAEAKAPQYHILENAKIIRRPNRGTKKSRGSQANVADKSKRDYNSYLTRQHTQSKSSKFGSLETIQEYRQNQTRNFWGDAEKAREYSERVLYHNKYNRYYYENKHWKYMERILKVLVPQVAKAIGATKVETTQGITPNDIADGSRYHLLNPAKSIFLNIKTGEILGL